jgi:hypothetical protein
MIPYSEVAAQAALSGQSLTPMASNAIPPPKPHQQPDRKKEESQSSTSNSTSSWSSMLGLWAWDKTIKKDTTTSVQQPATTQSNVDGTAGKP